MACTGLADCSSGISLDSVGAAVVGSRVSTAPLVGLSVGKSVSVILSPTDGAGVSVGTELTDGAAEGDMVEVGMGLMVGTAVGGSSCSGFSPWK